MLILFPSHACPLTFFPGSNSILSSSLALPEVSVPRLKRLPMVSLPSFFNTDDVISTPCGRSPSHRTWLTRTLLRISVEVMWGSCIMALKLLSLLDISYPRELITIFFPPSQLYCCWLMVILCLINEHRFPSHIIF